MDSTSKLADQQNARLEKQRGEIDEKLREVESAGTAVRSQSEAYRGGEVAKLEAQMTGIRNRAENEAGKLETTQKSIESSIQRVTERIDNTNIEQVYGQLGEKLYVVLQGKPSVGKAGKKPGEKWININLSPMAVGENRVTKQQLEELSRRLERMGYTPYFGTFGSGGPVGTGYGMLGFSGGSRVYFFDQNREKEASDLAKLAKETLGVPEIAATFDDVTHLDTVARQVVQLSGLDFQIFIERAPQK